MPEWLKDFDPGRIIKWIALVSMLGGGIYFVWSIPERLQGIESAVREMSENNARRDSTNNRTHLELMLNDCEILEIPLRDCLR